MESKLKKLAKQWCLDEITALEDNYYCETRDVFQARLEKMVVELLEQKKADQEKVYIASAIAGEIGNNSFDHNLGNWPKEPGVFFGYLVGPDRMQIVLADKGTGVLTTLKKVLPDLQTHEKALEVAFNEKISGRSPEKRGNGLKFVKQSVINDNDICLGFYSGNAEARIEDDIRIKDSTINIVGCLAIIDSKF